MPVRQGRYTLVLPGAPGIVGYAAVVGKKESEGPLGSEFDYVYEDAAAGERSWEKAESVMHEDAVKRAVSKAGLTPGKIDAVFAGDLLNQCTGTVFGLRKLEIPFVGIYGACSTMALALAQAALCAESGIVETAVASTSSHFCSAEKQFRSPLEYGGQRTPTAQWTATAAAAAAVSAKSAKARVEKVIIGKICDYGVKDANNMGAAMAPAACETAADFLRDTGTRPEDYDLILTGDLGEVGSTLFRELMLEKENFDVSAVHNDCGLMLYDLEKQKETGAGGSGCGCSGAVLCSTVLKKIESGEYKKVFFIGTGALMSSVSALQNETIPSIAHGILITGG